MIGAVGRRGLASVALTMLALALLGVGVTALAWWPERDEQSSGSRPVAARVLQSAPCGGRGSPGDLVEVRTGGGVRQQRFDGCGHTPGEQLQVLLPKNPSGKAKPAGSESGSSGGERLMWVLLTVAAVAGGGYGLLLPHIRQRGDIEEPDDPRRGMPAPTVAPRRTRGPRLPDDHPSGPNPAPLDQNATMPPTGSSPVGPASLPADHPSGPIPSPLDPNATMPPTGPDAKLPHGHPSGPNPLPIDPDATTLPPGGPTTPTARGTDGPPAPPQNPQQPNEPPAQPPNRPPQPPANQPPNAQPPDAQPPDAQPPNQPPQPPGGSVPPPGPAGVNPPTARGPMPPGAGGVDEPVPRGFRPDGFSAGDPVPDEPADEPRGRGRGRSGKSGKPNKREKRGKPEKQGKSGNPSKIEQLREARRKRKENPFDFA